uniref:Uncharacterized protein n=1 Tax=uncultured Chromatiales bacterium HF0200_41F04 TaxID=710740 RepID=E0XV39_9GAMM|nr:hypothetical protein [uncultured Chromatiales bacterium HF0200_41F04]
MTRKPAGQICQYCCNKSGLLVGDLIRKSLSYRRYSKTNLVFRQSYSLSNKFDKPLIISRLIP